jgi:hypothetical protein
MPPDDALPPSRLPASPSAEQIARHFVSTFGVRVDLDALPAASRLSLAGARVPEPPEAALLDRVLQLVPAPLLTAVDRILVVDRGETGRAGSYDSRIIRIRTPALNLREGDPIYRRRFSLFTTTVLHELAHAVYEEWLTPEQRDLVLDDYIAFLERSGAPTEGEPSETGVQHHLAAIMLTALLGYSRPFISVSQARRAWERLGVLIR